MLIHYVTNEFAEVHCPVCETTAKLVRYTTMLLRTKHKLVLVFHCKREDCDTEFTLDIWNGFDGDATIEHRPEKVSKKHSTMYSMTGV